MKVQVQSPEQAFNQSRDMFRNLTGRGSPDILFIASCMWCVNPPCNVRTAGMVLSVRRLTLCWAADDSLTFRCC